MRNATIGLAARRVAALCTRCNRNFCSTPIVAQLSPPNSRRPHSLENRRRRYRAEPHGEKRRKARAAQLHNRRHRRRLVVCSLDLVRRGCRRRRLLIDDGERDDDRRRRHGCLRDAGGLVESALDALRRDDRPRGAIADLVAVRVEKNRLNGKRGEKAVRSAASTLNGVA